MARNKVIDDMMRADGYISVSEAAKKTGFSQVTIYSWIDKGEISGRQQVSFRYVNLRSLVDKIGIDVSVRMGLITQDQASGLKKEAAKAKKG